MQRHFVLPLCLKSSQRVVAFLPGNLNFVTAIVLSVLMLISAIAGLPLRASADDNSIGAPAELRSWIDWVKERNPEMSCPLLRAERACVWPGHLALELGSKGGTFHYNVYLDRKGEVPLPGGGEVWPFEIGDQGSTKGAVTASNGDRPSVFVTAGVHNLSGRFAWESMPKSLSVPAELGVIDLSVDGAKIENPKISADGQLWLQHEEQTETAEEDTVKIEVRRKLIDGLPFEVDTELELRVSGKAREISLGNILLAGFQPFDVESDLQYRLDKNWNVILQLKPGQHSFQIRALTSVPPADLAAPTIKSSAWPSEETWVFAANEVLRSVELGGAPGIDPNRTTLPDDWRNLPAFVLTPQTKLTLNETRRGQKDLLPNQLNLHRDIWLDLDGRGYTIHDQVSGQLNRDWRLNMSAPTILGHAQVDNADQLITEDPSSKLGGVELRTQAVNVEGVSRIEGAMRVLPAVGWDHDVNSLDVSLRMGPGWSLLEASGADNNASTWFSSWRLWDIFLVCLVAIAVAKLLGVAWGAAAFALLVLCHLQPGAPIFIWISLLAAKALLNVVPEGQFRRIVQIFFFITFVLLLSIILPFAIDQLRLGLFPQLTPAFQPGEIFQMIIIPTLVLCGLAACAGFIVNLFRGRFRHAITLLLIGGVVWLCAAIIVPLFISSSYNENRRIDAFMSPQSAPVPRPKAMALGGRLREQALQKSADSAALESDLAIGYAGNGAPAEAESDEDLKLKLLQVDPKAVVQTGSAVPTWSWSNWDISWSGPVEKGRTLTLYLLSPRINCLLSFLRVLLIFALSLAFLNVKNFRAAMERYIAPALVALLFLHPVFLFPGSAQAQNFPDASMLNELQERVDREICKTDCTSADSMEINLHGDQLTVDATVSSRDAGAWSIPGPLSELMPSAITLDGAATNILRRSPDGLIWVRVPNGAHKISVKGSLGDRTSVTLQLGLIPKHVEVHSTDWTVDGLTPFGSSRDSLQFVRKADGKSNTAAQGVSGKDELPLADWYLVTRHIDVALPWSVTTTVQRLGRNDRSRILRVPLLSGESVNGSSVKMEGSKAVVNFERDENEVSWTSNLDQAPRLTLTALTDMPISETWKLRCSAIWKCNTSGISPLDTVENGENTVVWTPWPGDKVEVAVAKPLGVEGRTETLSNVNLQWQPGSGLLRAALNFELRSSQGNSRKIMLPDGAALESVEVNGVRKNVSLTGRELVLPVVPGNQNYAINWRQPWDVSFIEHMPAVDLGTLAENVEVQVTVPQKRWPLFVWGPAWGPAVMFWGQLIVVAIFAIILGRIRLQPLSSVEWLLLGLGMTTLHPALLLLPVICFLALSARKARPSADRLKFNLSQVALGALVTLTVIVLYASIYNGLIVDPDMGISGHGSSNYSLSWYVDHTASQLPTPSVMSVPVWCFRAVMLCWSSWLVFALLRWLKWGWGAFSSDGLWRSKAA